MIHCNRFAPLFLTIAAAAFLFSPSFSPRAQSARAAAPAPNTPSAASLLQAKKFPEAEAAFRQTLATNPNDTIALDGLAESLQGQNKFAEAAATYERLANLLSKQTAPPAPARTPTAAAPPPVAVPNPARPAPVTAQAPAPVPIPPDRSTIVTQAPTGQLGVAQKNGAPFDGTKLSTHDSDIISPSLAVTSDGTIHVAFTERHKTNPFPYGVYYRQSTDAGKTWSEPKNLSEDMPDFVVGTCKLLVDSNDRLYVIWRTGIKERFAALQTPAGPGQNNLVFRNLDRGKWSKILPIHPPASAETQDNGSISFMAATDAAGRAQVLWNVLPDRFHPNEVMVVSPGFTQHITGIGAGLVFQATLDGATPPTPREAYMTKLKIDPDPNLAGRGKSCDDLDALEGYVDANGSPHFIARVRDMLNLSAPNTRIDLIEDGKQSPAIILPGPITQTSANPPKLLLDAKGRRHIIAFYNAGEHPAIRDYLLNSDDEPTTILAAKAPRGTIYGFQAYQGPAGQMVAVIQTTNEGLKESGDTYLSTSDGTKWSAPICVTNNAARLQFWSKDVGVLVGVSNGYEFGPGEGGVAFDKQGHLLLALINVKVGSFAQAVGGVAYSIRGTSSPMLFFYKF